MKVVVQQALFHRFVQPVTRIADLAGINPRTAWNHIHAAQNSHVKPWDRRSAAEQDSAIEAAEQIVKGNPAMCHVPSRHTSRPRIPAGILHAMIDAEIDKRVQANATFTAYTITLALRAANPANDIAHSEVQARVRFVMAGDPDYEMFFLNWNGRNARTWRPVQSQPVGAVKIVDNDRGTL